jgi:lysophospholipase L1-like esterase
MEAMGRTSALIGLFVFAATTAAASSSALGPQSLSDTAAGFSWSMPERYNGEDRNNDGLADYFTPLNYERFHPTPFYDPIHPSEWWVDLAADSCPSDSAVQWWVDSKLEAAGCSTRVFLSEGPHLVSVVYNGTVGDSETVTPKDWLIAVLGDSYGSGEGNPDVSRKRRRWPLRDKRSRWEDRQCHRSAKSGAAQAAAKVEKADERSSVTFLHLSCSGATIESGLLGDHAGAAPNADKKRKKKPQVQELQELLGERTPDALLISIGGNDIGFAKIVRSCLFRPNCHKPGKKARKTFEAGIRKLPGRYAKLARALDPLGITASRVVITGYPDATRYDDREVCGKGKRPKLLHEAPRLPRRFRISAKEARWASETVSATLNRTLRSLARSRGWTFVGGHIGPSRRHGDCAKNPWFVTWDEAKRRQESRTRIFSPGILHPNERGHRAYRDAMLHALRKLGVPTG